MVTNGWIMSDVNVVVCLFGVNTFHPAHLVKSGEYDYEARGAKNKRIRHNSKFDLIDAARIISPIATFYELISNEDRAIVQKLKSENNNSSDDYFQT